MVNFSAKNAACFAEDAIPYLLLGRVWLCSIMICNNGGWGFGMFNTIAIPDAGPVIALGRIGRIDLLDQFNCQILLTDMVAADLRHGRSAAFFKAWQDATGSRIQTVETTMGIVWETLTDAQRSGLRRITDARETAIWQFSNSLRKKMSSTQGGVVLFTDSAVKRIDFGPHIAKVTIWSFLTGLEDRGMITSAEDIFASILKSGQIVPKDPFAAPARSAAAGADWTHRIYRH